MKNWVRFLTLSMAFCAFAHSIRAAAEPCKFYIRRSLANEWENEDIGTDVRIAKGEASPILAGFFDANAILFRSKFAQLFSLYGQGKSGEWHRNFIPTAVTEGLAFRRAIGILKMEGKNIRLEPSDGGVVINEADLAALTPDELRDLTMGALEARGKNVPGLQLRKNPAAWAKDADPLDALIPENVSEEWKFDDAGVPHLRNFEFPFVGHTQQPQVLRDFMAHMWHRFGLVDKFSPDVDHALALADAHVHWVPWIHDAPVEMRQDLYQAVLNRWGDLNDTASVRYLGSLSLGHDGYATLSAAEALTLGNGVAEEFNNGFWISPLTRDLYGAVGATKDGIAVLDSSLTITSSIDPHFPKVLKLLPFGLRSKYKGPPGTEVRNGVVAMPGIEGRADRFDLNLNDVIAADETSGDHANEVDVAKLLASHPNGPRGLVSDWQVLANACQAKGIDPGVIGTFDRVFRPATPELYSWSDAQRRGYGFAPLGPWLEHPLVKLRLAGRSEHDRAAFIANYQAALDRYVKRINDLVNAYRARDPSYKPDWANFTDAQKIHDRDEEFRVVFMSEAYRFMSESKLNELLKPVTP